MIEQAVVLVGGLGTRLGALTSQTPKPLLPVGGRPFLNWLLDELRRQGVGQVILSAGYRGELIEEAVNAFPDVSVRIEPEPLGTGGALRFLASDLAERFFFLNGDSLFDINLWDLALAAGDADAALALRRLPDVSRYGAVSLADDGRVARFEARAAGGGPGLVNGGVAVLSRAVVERVAPAGAVSLEAEVYPGLAAAGRMRGRVYHRPFIDIGVPEDFAVAQGFVPRVLRRPAVVFAADLQADEALAAAVKAANDAGLSAFLDCEPAGCERRNQALRGRGASLDGCDRLGALLALGRIEAPRAVLVTREAAAGQAARAAGLACALLAPGDGGVVEAVTEWAPRLAQDGPGTA